MDRTALKPRYEYCLKCDNPECLHEKSCPLKILCKKRADYAALGRQRCCDGFRFPSRAKYGIQDLMYRITALEAEVHRLKHSYCKCYVDVEEEFDIV